MKKLYIYPLILLAITAIASSCTKGGEGAIVPQGNELVVKAELISSSAWASRAAGDGIIYGNSSQTDDGEYIITAQKQEWKGDTTSISNAPATRGTPISTASGIANMRINVFNTGTTNWTTSSTLTQALTATNSGGGFSVSPAYNWATNATAKTTLFAFSPTPTGSNGITDVAPNKITYLVPTTVGNQPDLCTAVPGVDIINLYGTEQSRTFYMNHQLTAVGFSMLGWNLKITSITLSDIVVQGTLTMNSNGTSSWTTSATGSRSVGVTQNSYQHTINNSYANITTSDGYLMMIPHALSAAATVTINYSSTGTGSESGTITAKLNELGVTWNAGDKITYNIRLKTAPAVTSGDLIIDNPKAGYTTTNAVSMVMDNRDKLTFTWNAAWLKIHQGAPKAGDTRNGALSGWTTNTGGPWSNIYFFATNDNIGSLADRTTTVTVKGTRSGTKTFIVTQRARKTHPPTPGHYLFRGGKLWATGPLVRVGDYECRVGEDNSTGLYFKFGSLIGWSGGSDLNGGPGGSPALKMMTCPIEMNPAPSAWKGASSSQIEQYFSYTGGEWSSDNSSAHIRNFNASISGDQGTGNLASGRYAALGVGDPCTYYLGEFWRLPTQTEMGRLCKENGYNAWTNISGTTGRWVNSIFFPASGYRHGENGSIQTVGLESRTWTGSPKGPYNAYYMFLNNSTLTTPDNSPRNMALSVRCVAD